MKKMKCMLSAMLAVVMLLSCSAIAFATDTEMAESAVPYVSSPIVVKVPNKITASNIRVKASRKAQTIRIRATAKGGAALTYRSSSKYVTVSKRGNATIAKKFVGTAKITIYAAETTYYRATTKTIYLTTTKTPMAKPGRVKVTHCFGVYKSKIRLYWKRVSPNCDNYEIRVYSNSARTRLVKTIYCARTTTSKSVIGLRTNTRYYISIRALNRKSDVTRTTTYGAWTHVSARTLR